jgi:hypothetical protein
VWTSLASIACIAVGTYWDISWHMTVGRDTFWTPAHLVIQAGGLLAGGGGTYLILSTTLRRDREAPAITVWGFRGPLGAFVAVWGAATMLVSAPFDNWWHNAYGLDVKIISPPHVVLTLGILAVATGGILLTVSAFNRAGESQVLDRVVLVVGGMTVLLSLTAILEMTFRANLHRADAYRAMGHNVPVFMLAFARVSRRKWAATFIAGFYTAFMLVMLWLFALIPAQPKLGPVYQPITHMIPLQFPLLILAPAIAIDLVRAHLAHWPRWRLGALLGVVFVVVLVAAEWPFADFAMSPAARNWFFGSQYHPYFARPEWFEVRYEFVPDPDLWLGLVKAALFAMASSYLGLVVGDAMKKVQR